MGGGGGIGIPQDCWPKAGFEVDGIPLVAFQCAVEVEGATSPRTCHHGDSRALAISSLGGTSYDRRVVHIRTEAGQCDDVAIAAFHSDSRHGRIAIGPAACATRTRIGRKDRKSVV